MVEFFKKLLKVHRTDDYVTEAVSLNAVYTRAVVVMVEVFEIVMLFYTISLADLKYRSVYIGLYLTVMLVSLYGIYYLFFKNKTLREVHDNSRKVYVYSSFYPIPHVQTPSIRTTARSRASNLLILICSSSVLLLLFDYILHITVCQYKIRKNEPCMTKT